MPTCNLADLKLSITCSGTGTVTPKEPAANAVPPVDKKSTSQPATKEQ